MAIYHLSMKIIKRSAGKSVVAAAAYRSGNRLFDERYQTQWHYHKKQKHIGYSEILAPDNAPEWVKDRGALWNTIEAIEKRKDAQLAREMMVALPRELTRDEQIDLLKNYCQKNFVDKGMIADINMHIDNPDNPHAHILLTLREVTPEGFGKKVVAWNQRSLLRDQRKEWELFSNEALARAGFDQRIDCRSLQDQGIDLIPNLHLGVACHHAKQRGEGKSFGRYQDALSIMEENGKRLLENPEIALRKLTQQQATFSDRDIMRLVNTYTADVPQFQALFSAIREHKEIVALSENQIGHRIYTTRDMIQLEASLVQKAQWLNLRDGFPVSEFRTQRAAEQHNLSEAQKTALSHILKPAQLSLLVGYAGTGKSYLMRCAREAWEAAGYQVCGTALSGIAAEGLEKGSGIPSKTIDSYLYQWEQGKMPLSKNHVLVLDEAGMVDTRKLEKIIHQANLSKAKVVMIGDPGQLQAIESGAPFRLLARTLGCQNLEEIRRQEHPEMRKASVHLAKEEAGEALKIYEQLKAVHFSHDIDKAIDTMVAHWDKDRRENPNKTQLLLAHQREHVLALNQRIRALRQVRGELMDEVVCQVKRNARDLEFKERTFANGDQVYFCQNDAQLGVKNGHLGTVVYAREDKLLISTGGHMIDVCVKEYPYLDYGYAATIHKSQGITVDKAYLLVTKTFDRHLSYVGMTRHKSDLEIHVPRADFLHNQALVKVLSRDRVKDMVLDYSELRDLDGIIKNKDTIIEKNGKTLQQEMIEWDLKQETGKFYSFIEPGEHCAGTLVEFLNTQQCPGGRGVILTDKGELKILPKLKNIRELDGKSIFVDLDHSGAAERIGTLQKDEKGRGKYHEMPQKLLFRTEVSRDMER
jgi:Ti-type conjugative transfer relaxase TraA